MLNYLLIIKLKTIKNFLYGKKENKRDIKKSRTQNEKNLREISKKICLFIFLAFSKWLKYNDTRRKNKEKEVVKKWIDQEKQLLKEILKMK